MISRPPSYRSAILVTLQLGLMAWLCLGTEPTWRRPASALLVVAGVALGVWAVVAMRPSRVTPWPEPRADAELVVRGPYAWIRHPMYASLLLAGAGLVAHTFTAGRLAALLLLAPVLCLKMWIEERALRARLPGYAAYALRTKRVVPFVF
ncbi:MAG: isoprenylcysteine carboxylmethyltransferase family protein [Lentisphaerae bacterium]|nr:isoprenylcysteine carboxylmethyltransferase family protein [Lentisphaerota bacterium]